LQRDTEIDRLVIAPWGIYSLEAKSFKTALMGSLEDDYWVGITGRKLTRIYNPIMQNFEHIRCLKRKMRSLFGSYPSIINYVVVPDSCDIKTDAEGFVLNISELLDRIVADSMRGNKIDFRQVAASLEERK
jgi:hypothetical protein